MVPGLGSLFPLQAAWVPFRGSRKQQGEGPRVPPDILAEARG